VIAIMRVSDDRVKMAKTQQLHRKFELTTFNDGETVEDYAMHLSGMVVDLGTLGDEVRMGRSS
jgi:hypothetical protein